MHAIDGARVDLNFLVALPPALLGRLAREAPGVRLEVSAPPPELAPRLAEGALDLAVVPARRAGPGLVRRALGEAHWCVLARRDHPAVAGGRLDLRAWLASPHVVAGARNGPGLVGSELERHGLERRIGFVAPGSLAAAHAVAHADWFFASPRELIGGLADGLGLVALEPPVALPPVRVAMIYHERMRADPGRRRPRGVIAEVIAAALAPVLGTPPRPRHRAPRANARRRPQPT